MNEIHMLHGCSPTWRPGLQSVRNYVPEETFLQFLRNRPVKYGVLGDTKHGGSLTIDDSTHGGARACVLARENSHEITLFVNPAQIESQRSYWFSRLDVVLDSTKRFSVTADGCHYDLNVPDSLRTFRLALKEKLRAMSDDEADLILDELSDSLDCKTAIVPDHAQTMTLDVLRHLVSIGVAIGSHGWNHRDISTMTNQEIIYDFEIARAWFDRHLGFFPADYAVPYGICRLNQAAVKEVPRLILMANPTFDLGYCGFQHWNRRDITRTLHGRLT